MQILVPGRMKGNNIHSFFFFWKDGATPLHYAVQVSAVQTVKLLIKYKVDVNVADNVSI